jgi:hypothetical protein
MKLMGLAIAALLFFSVERSEAQEFRTSCTIYAVNASPFPIILGLQIQKSGEAGVVGEIAPADHRAIYVPCDVGNVYLMAVASGGNVFTSSGTSQVLFGLRFSPVVAPGTDDHLIVLLR